MIIKMASPKDKERILKAAREKWVITYKGAPIRLRFDFSTETFQARKERHEIFKVMKSKDLQPRLLHPARLPFKIEGDIEISRQEKVLQTSTATNVKGLSLRRRKKEKERKKTRKQ